MSPGDLDCCGTHLKFLAMSRTVLCTWCDLWCRGEMVPWLVFSGYILIFSFGLSRIFGPSIFRRNNIKQYLSGKNGFNQFFCKFHLINLVAGIPSLCCREELEKVASCGMLFL